MLLWIAIIALTGAAIFAVLAPLGREPKPRAAVATAKGVYLEQLAEIEKDQAEGRLPPAEAESARAEIARRLIALDREEDRELSPQGSSRARRLVAFGALGGIPVLSLGLYLGLGAPQLPGEPLAARLESSTGQNNVEVLIAQVEDHLARNPEDGRGWDVIAPVYLRIGRIDDAARAFGNAIRLVGSSAERQSGLGEALVASAGGVITEEARAAFAAAAEADPSAVGPRYYLALAAEQEGKHHEAATGLRELLSSAPADAPWRETVEAALAKVEGDAPPGPTSEEVAAAADMDPAARQEMIEGMVSQLAERLQREPEDAEGWLRLVRAYSVLGRPDDARAAAESALSAIDVPEDRQRISALVADLGLSAEGAARP